ncbi:MAG: hypothetical protein E7032_06425 [Akkermansiaceae bacterium]|nr:hypothetical protein [Akkermansiaceae bacterium]
MEPEYPADNNEKWLQLQLWGLDTPITALCWAIACAALMQITMITAGPLLLVAGGVWCMVMLMRLKAAITRPGSWHAAFYRGHLPLILVLLVAVGLSTLWMMFFYVGRNIFTYAFFPCSIFLASRLMIDNAWFKEVKLLMQATAFAMFCAIPAFYFSFTLSPLHMLTTGPVWYLGILFYLMARERERLRTRERNAQSVIITTVTLILLLAATLVSSVTAPMFERTLCVTIAIGAGCLQGFARIANLLPGNAALALSWLAMALPAVLGIMLYAPHSW